MSSKSLDGVLTKKANQKETYTNSQIEDIAKCMDPDKDTYTLQNILRIYNTQ